MLLDRPYKVESEDFGKTVLEASPPVLVDFYADWCGPCKMVAPVMDEIARERVGELLVAKVDSDRAPDVVARYGIRGIPTIILFRDGEEVARSVGFNPQEIRGLAEKALE